MRIEYANALCYSFLGSEEDAVPGFMLGLEERDGMQPTAYPSGCSLALGAIFATNLGDYEVGQSLKVTQPSSLSFPTLGYIRQNTV